MIAHRYVDTRLALAGDAAHGIHPIAGQGLNLGFRDGDRVGGPDHRRLPGGEDVGGAALLARYQRVRQADNLLMFAMTDGLDRLFSTDRRPVRVVRDIGIDAVNRLGPVKRMFMRRAMGVAAAGRMKHDPSPDAPSASIATSGPSRLNTQITAAAPCCRSSSWFPARYGPRRRPSG